eukprot:scaffold16496_cov120-Isochrysis_galbana.AAC.4
MATCVHASASSTQPFTPARPARRERPLTQQLKPSRPAQTCPSMPTVSPPLLRLVDVTARINRSTNHSPHSPTSLGLRVSYIMVSGLEAQTDGGGRDLSDLEDDRRACGGRLLRCAAVVHAALLPCSPEGELKQGGACQLVEENHRHEVGLQGRAPPRKGARNLGGQAE